MNLSERCAEAYNAIGPLTV